MAMTIVHAALTGIHPDNLQLTLAGQTPTIRGEAQEPDLPASAHYRRRERATNAHHRGTEDSEAGVPYSLLGALCVSVVKATPVGILVHNQAAF
jgi:hypothetical protein